MASTVTGVSEAFHHLYEAIHRKDFRKTMPMHAWRERDLLPIARAFLLGWFGSVAPEHTVRLPGSASGFGRIDFLVGDVAVEFAVRRPMDRKGPLSDKVNAAEVKKLMMHDGPSVLVLFDFSRSPFDTEDLERFRQWPSLGRGNFRRHAFNVSYHHVADTRSRSCKCIRLNIRVALRCGSGSKGRPVAIRR